MKLSSAFVLALPLSIALILSCTKKSVSNADAGSPEALAERGSQIYKLNCVACHSSNPKNDGALGPATWGSSLELLSARILKAQYPEGYKPKRDTMTMPALPQLAAELPALHAYLSR